MNEIDYFNKAKEYLLSFDNVTNEMIDAQLNAWKHKKHDDIQSLFKSFLHHAKNRQSMPNSIGDIEKLKSTLFNFNHLKIIATYKTWDVLFDSIKKSKYKPPGRMVKNNNKSHWVIFCKSIISISEFLSSYQSMEEFEDFVNGFLTNEQSKLALPLLLKEEIFGFGFALACDFLKENVSPEFIKPDTHINYIAQKLGITSSNKNYHIFKDVEAYCNRIQVLPYEVDKLFWLVGSGNFYLSDIKVRASKIVFVSTII